MQKELPARAQAAAPQLYAQKWAKKKNCGA